jgi:plastocyanin
MKNSGSLFAAVLAVSMSIGLSGCRSKHNEIVHETTPSSKITEAGTGVPIDPATTGAIDGMVHFTGKPPERLKIDMSQDPACSATGGENFAEQYVVHDGGFANVYVYVKSGPEAAGMMGQVAPAPVVLDQKGCQYVPHVVAVMQGGVVEFRNSDGTMHNIHTMPQGRNPGMDVSQGPKGAPEQKKFNKPETMIPVRCNNHPWMSAFINVSATPFFAVTDNDGHFEIKGLPPGMYTLAAVHEKMGEQTITVKIASKERAKAEFTYSMK